MYKVIEPFSDEVDGGVYRAGMEYPKPGVKPDEERIAYLMGAANKLGKPVIQKSEDAPPKKSHKPKE